MNTVEFMNIIKKIIANNYRLLWIALTCLVFYFLRTVVVVYYPSLALIDICFVLALLISLILGLILLATPNSRPLGKLILAFVCLLVAMTVIIYNTIDKVVLREIQKNKVVKCAGLNKSVIDKIVNYIENYKKTNGKYPDNINDLNLQTRFDKCEINYYNNSDNGLDIELSIYSLDSSPNFITSMVASRVSGHLYIMGNIPSYYRDRKIDTLSNGWKFFVHQDVM